MQVTRLLDFKPAKDRVTQRFSDLVRDTIRVGVPYLFVVDLDKDVLWETYLSSFPADHRQEFTCNACKQFVKNYGGLVAVVNNRLRSFWRTTTVDPVFQKVFDNMADLVESASIRDVFLSTHKRLGVDSNKALLTTEDGTESVITWNHLSLELPKEILAGIKGFTTVDSALSTYRTGKQVLQRALEEISIDTVETVLELIAQNSLYRGAEHKTKLENFLNLQKNYIHLSAKERDSFVWVECTRKSNIHIIRIKNSAVGTLLEDIQSGMDLDAAVSRWERTVAPANYRRPTPIFTAKMLEAAKKSIADLGYTNSLERRIALASDISANNLLFVDDGTVTFGKVDEVFKTLEADAVVNTKAFSRVETISLKDFLDNVLPISSGLEILFENRHVSHLASLIAPTDMDSPSMFSWANGFSWCYTNALADSDIITRVKNAGGQVTGFIVCSLGWSNTDDLDLHLVEPNGNKVYFPMQSRVSPMSGATLDVDMNAGKFGNHVTNPVENIYFPYGSENRMMSGVYAVVVNCYARRNTSNFGFDLEFRYDGETIKLNYPHRLDTGKNVLVLKFLFDNKTKTITDIQYGSEMKPGESSVVSQTKWNLGTNKFHKVTAVLNSPNYWDGEPCTGNKHTFFILDRAINEDASVRPFFNEMLKSSLVATHKKVFEALAGKLIVPKCTDSSQLSGLGISSTQKIDFICRVTGKMTRTLRVVNN